MKRGRAGLTLEDVRMTFGMRFFVQGKRDDQDREGLVMIFDLSHLTILVSQVRSQIREEGEIVEEKDRGEG